MNYSDLMDQMAKRVPSKNSVKLSFDVKGNPGDVMTANLIYRILSKDLDGTTIEILQKEREDGTERPQVIPSPS